MTAVTKKRMALFLDRDGVINKDYGYVYRIEDFDFYPEIFEICRKIGEIGIPIVVITNQSGIGRTLFTLDDFYIVNQWMLSQFAMNGIDIEKVYFCSSAPSDAFDFRRKPSPGMFIEAAEELEIDLNRSIMIGDKESDMIAAKAAQIENRIIIGDSLSKGTAATSMAKSHATLWDAIGAFLPT